LRFRLPIPEARAEAVVGIAGIMTEFGRGARDAAWEGARAAARPLLRVLVRPLDQIPGVGFKALGFLARV
jgi:hypothetical protein